MFRGCSVPGVLFCQAPQPDIEVEVLADATNGTSPSTTNAPSFIVLTFVPDTASDDILLDPIKYPPQVIALIGPAAGFQELNGFNRWLVPPQKGSPFSELQLPTYGKLNRLKFLDSRSKKRYIINDAIRRFDHIIDNISAMLHAIDSILSNGRRGSVRAPHSEKSGA
jgi:hypothetical protein